MSLYFIIREEGNVKHASGHYHVRLGAVVVEPGQSNDCVAGGIKSPSWAQGEFSHLDGFLVYSQGNLDGDRYLYGWDVSFGEKYRISRRDAELMAKMLAKVEKGLDKLHEQAGPPGDYAEYCSRVARVLKAKGFLVPTPGSASGYAYRVLSVADAVSHVRHLDHAYRTALKEEAA